MSKINWACSLGARSSELCPESTGHARLALAQVNTHQFNKKNFGFQTLFPQNSQFWSFPTQNSFQIMFTGHIHKNTLNDAWNLRLKHHFIKIQQFTKLSQIFNNNNSHHQITNRDTHDINSSSTCSKTTSTINNHEFTYNPTTTTSLFTNFTQKHNIPTYITFGIQIHHQQHNYHSIHIYEHTIKT